MENAGQPVVIKRPGPLSLAGSDALAPAWRLWEERGRMVLQMGSSSSPQFWAITLYVLQQALVKLCSAIPCVVRYIPVHFFAVLHLFLDLVIFSE